MISGRCRFVAGFLAAATMAAGALGAQTHVARRLGHPSTRFAEPVQTPEELRARLTAPGLQADIVVVLGLCDAWRGDIEDFRRAAASAPITAFQIPIGARLPAMSSRKNGRPIVLRDLVWGGKEPIDAYEFRFYSRGSLYRCVTPKVCCNFWVENLGPDTRVPVLALECMCPDAVLPSRPVQVCVTVRNTGEVPDGLVTVALPVPEGAVYVSEKDGPNPAARRLLWRFPDLAPGAAKRVCAEFTAAAPCAMLFAASATGAAAAPASSECTTVVTGVAGVLFEVIDVEDAIEVGAENTYEIRVSNQGMTPLTNLRVVCTLEASQEFLRGSGPTAVSAQGRTVTCAPLAELAPNGNAVWQLAVKALAPGDVRFSAQLSSDQCERPVEETESTWQY